MKHAICDVLGVAMTVCVLALVRQNDQLKEKLVKAEETNSLWREYEEKRECWPACEGWGSLAAPALDAGNAGDVRVSAPLYWTGSAFALAGRDGGAP